MTKLKALTLALAAFASGIVFVLACSDDAAPRIDAGRPADAADCPRCESAIMPDMYYISASSWTTLLAGRNPLTAECDEPGDMLISGGCWIYKIGTPVDISQPPPPLPDLGDIRVVIAGPYYEFDGEIAGPAGKNGSARWPIRWQCVIDNPGADRTDLRPVAFATCLDLTP